MRMKPEHADRLNALLKLPHLSPRSTMILIRRMARLIHADHERAREFLNEQERKARAGLPSTKRQLAAVWKLRREGLRQYRTGLCALGSWICRNDVALTAHHGFEGICDALEVNPVHRGEVRASAEDRKRAVAAVAFVSGFEDSAGRQSGRHPIDWKDGPLFQIFMAMRQKSMAEGLEGVAHSLTSDGLQFPPSIPLGTARNDREGGSAGGTQLRDWGSPAIDAAVCCSGR